MTKKKLHVVEFDINLFEAFGLVFWNGTMAEAAKYIEAEFTGVPKKRGKVPF